MDWTFKAHTAHVGIQRVARSGDIVFSAIMTDRSMGGTSGHWEFAAFRDGEDDYIQEPVGWLTWDGVCVRAQKILRAHEKEMEA